MRDLCFHIIGLTIEPKSAFSPFFFSGLASFGHPQLGPGQNCQKQEVFRRIWSIDFVVNIIYTQTYCETYRDLEVACYFLEEARTQRSPSLASSLAKTAVLSSTLPVEESAYSAVTYRFPSGIRWFRSAPVAPQLRTV